MKHPTLRIKVMSRLWSVRFLPDDKFEKGDQALTHPDEREILFRRSKTTLPDIVHELTHAYFSECGLGASASISTEQVEELACEMFARHGFALLVQAADIYRAYKGLKK